MSRRRAVRLRIRGRVQGVWFRGWTCQQATRLGLAGWVRNCSDGSVEALFVGAADAVEAMVAACRRGPTHARVESVVADELSDAASLELDGFSQQRD